MTTTTERGAAPGTAPAPHTTAAPAAAATAKKIKLPREEDPRNPNLRLQALLVVGSVELITPDDDSGMLAATGTINGCRVVAFCSDATVMGGAMGTEGCEEYRSLAAALEKPPGTGLVY
jgi:acetyl-CoA/propionyl-CoA carboxylase carboxyl transferase subunit